MRIRSRCPAIPSRIRQRKVKMESGAFSRLAVDRDSTAVGLHDALADGKAEAHAFLFLGGEKRTKNVDAIFRRDPHAAIGYRESQFPAGRGARFARLGAGRGGADFYGSAARHRL